MSGAGDHFAPRDPSLFLLQVLDGRGVWRTRKRLGSVVAAVREVAAAPSAYAVGRLRLIEVGCGPATGATVHREVLRAGGDARSSRAEFPGDGSPDAQALVSALRDCGEWAGRRRASGRAPRVFRAAAAIAVVIGLGMALLGDARWSDARWSAPGQSPGAASLAAALGSMLEAAGPPIELIGAALAREIAPERAAYPAPHLSFGVSWRETLDGAMRAGTACREMDSALVACELGRVWLRDAQSARLLFDRRDGHLAAVLVVSRLLVDSGAGKDGLGIKRRFAEIKRTIEGLLGPGYTASVRTDSPAGVPFWSGLRGDDGRGEYAAYWIAGGNGAGPTVSLRLHGIDAARGFYRLLVERPS